MYVKCQFGSVPALDPAAAKASNCLACDGPANLNCGTATFTGAGTTWRNVDSLVLGYAGNGTLTVAAVPEPGSYAMFAAGLGLMGFMVRRMRQSQPV